MTGWCADGGRHSRDGAFRAVVTKVVDTVVQVRGKSIALRRG